MPTYRIELASTGRAGCKNKECQEKKEKILKGELRLGTFVDTEQFQSWAWKHWGCVTPKQVASIQEIVDDKGERDMTLLDGYDEIPAESQKKVSDAVEQGHVADEDWRGDIEVNRPGKIGFRVRVSKQKETPKKKQGEKNEKAKTPRGRKRTREEDDEEEEEDVEEEEDDDVEDDEPPAKKAKATSRRKSKEVKSTAQDDDAAEEVQEKEKKKENVKNEKPKKEKKEKQDKNEKGEKTEKKEKKEKTEKPKKEKKSAAKTPDKDSVAPRRSGRTTRSRTTAAN